MNYDNLLIKICFNNKGIIKANINRINSDCINIYNYLYSKFRLSTEMTLKLIKAGYKEVPKCPCCGKSLKYIGKKNVVFQKYCSNSCRSKLVNKYIWINGQQKYNMEHYGVKYNVQTDEFKEKRKQTLIDRYDDAHFNNLNKHKETCLYKYGKDSFNNPIKHKETCLQRYNETCYNKTVIGRQKLSEILKRPDVRKKSNSTKRKNHTFNTSKPETESYELLKEKYPDVKYQYSSNAYPFNCDFYIPSLDLYIECNYHWSHGFKPFNIKSFNDRETLADWEEKSKTSNFYKNAIQTWAIRDVKKRETAKQNKLNYIEFWSIKELKTWIDTVQ